MAEAGEAGAGWEGAEVVAMARTVSRKDLLGKAEGAKEEGVPPRRGQVEVAHAGGGTEKAGLAVAVAGREVAEQEGALSVGEWGEMAAGSDGGDRRHGRGAASAGVAGLHAVHLACKGEGGRKT